MHLPISPPQGTGEGWQKNAEHCLQDTGAILLAFPAVEGHHACCEGVSPGGVV
jgi:hypothetical protein